MTLFPAFCVNISDIIHHIVVIARGKRKKEPPPAVLFSVVQLAAGVTKDLTGRVKAGELAGFVAGLLGGKGGGKPDLAMAGGSDVKKLPEALEAARAWIEGKL